MREVPWIPLLSWNLDTCLGLNPAVRRREKGLFHALRNRNASRVLVDPYTKIPTFLSPALIVFNPARHQPGVFAHAYSVQWQLSINPFLAELGNKHCLSDALSGLFVGHVVRMGRCFSRGFSKRDHCQEQCHS